MFPDYQGLDMGGHTDAEFEQNGVVADSGDWISGIRDMPVLNGTASPLRNWFTIWDSS